VPANESGPKAKPKARIIASETIDDPNPRRSPKDMALLLVEL
jgi:hypothetical protein